MAWYWWVLIGVVVIAGGYLKLKLFKKLMTKENKNEDLDE